MPELIKVYRQEVGPMRFIGKKYGDPDRGADGGFGRQWDQWWSSGWFDTVKQSAPWPADDPFENKDDTIGLMRWKEGEPFQYWIGLFTPEGAKVPEGFDSADFPKSSLGVGWLYGTEPDIYGKEDMAAKGLGEQGMKVITDGQGAFWFFERYSCPRYTTPDEKGNIILDICHFVE